MCVLLCEQPEQHCTVIYIDNCGKRCRQIATTTIGIWYRKNVYLFGNRWVGEWHCPRSPSAPHRQPHDFLACLCTHVQRSQFLKVFFLNYPNIVTSTVQVTGWVTITSQTPDSYRLSGHTLQALTQTGQDTYRLILVSYIIYCHSKFWIYVVRSGMIMVTTFNVNYHIWWHTKCTSK